MRLLNDIMQNKKEKTDVLMIIMRKSEPENRKKYFMMSLCRLVIRMIVLRIQKMVNWLQKYFLDEYMKEFSTKEYDTSSIFVTSAYGRSNTASSY